MSGAAIGNIRVTKEPALVATEEGTGGGGGGGLQMLSVSSLEAIEERNEGFRQLEADIVGANEIFRGLAIMVHEQGEVIDNIEANVESAAVHVETGNEQLVKASSHQKASRRKLYCILVIVVVAAGILGLVIYFLAK